MHRGVSRVSLMLLARALLVMASQGITGCKPSSSAGDYAGVNEDAPTADTGTGDGPSETPPGSTHVTLPPKTSPGPVVV